MLPGQELPDPARSANTPPVDPMPPKSLAGCLADGCPPHGLWLAAPAARAARPSAAALIGSFGTPVMRRWGRSRCVPVGLSGLATRSFGSLPATLLVSRTKPDRPNNGRKAVLLSRDPWPYVLAGRQLPGPARNADTPLVHACQHHARPSGATELIRRQTARSREQNVRAMPFASVRVGST